jgi:Putative Flp pilus-assembly TadE/G-like
MLCTGRAGITLRRKQRGKESQTLAVFPASSGNSAGERGPSQRQGIRGERGQTLILVVFALPLLFALIALVTDGSNLFANKRSVQNVADASVLAAVSQLNPCFGSGSVAACTSNVQSAATEYCVRNGGGDGTLPCSVASPLPACNDSSGLDPNSCYKTPYPGSGDYGVQVRIRRDVSLRFGGLLGLPSSPVRAKAAALLGVLGAAGNVAPIPIDKSKFCTDSNGQPRATWPPGTPPPDVCFGAPDITVSFDNGNNLLLSDLDIISTTGPVSAGHVNTNLMDDWIKSGHPGTLPANAWYGGDLDSGNHGGIQNFFPGGSQGLPAGTPMFIPLYDTRDIANSPPNWYHVVGFAAFVISNVRWSNVHQLTGHWVKFVDSGVVSSCDPSSPCDDFGVHGVALDE